MEWKQIFVLAAHFGVGLAAVLIDRPLYAAINRWVTPWASRILASLLSFSIIFLGLPISEFFDVWGSGVVVAICAGLAVGSIYRQLEERKKPPGRWG